MILNWCHREPTLEDILSDSITKAVMEADGVDPQQLAGPGPTCRPTLKAIDQEQSLAAVHHAIGGSPAARSPPLPIAIAGVPATAIPLLQRMLAEKESESEKE
jgi:hypothetical protein